MTKGIIKTNAELEAAEKKAMEEKEQASKPVLTNLAAFIKGAFDAAENHRQISGVTERMTKSRRLKSGEYEAAKLAQIKSVGSSDLFYNITEPKCEAFVAWMTDVFNSGTDTPWGIDPTPIPSLSVQETQRVQELVVERFEGLLASGQPFNPADVTAFAQDLYDETLSLKVDEAEEKSQRMKRLIEDQTEEGGFGEALSCFFDDLGDYPTAVLKGPIFVKKNRLKWEQGGLKVAEEVIPTWTCVDPFNFYPGPNARHVNESYVCEIYDYDRGDLANMRGVSGWKDEAIEQALSLTKQGSTNSNDNLPGESEMRTYEDKETLERGGAPDATIRALEFWGNVQGELLQQWGMDSEKAPDKFKSYQVNAVMIDNIVVRCVINPHPLGHKPYYTSSFIKNKNSIWGLHSIPEKIEECQEGVNVCQRNLLNNLAMGAGPQVVVDLDALEPSHVSTCNQQYPMKVWPVRGGNNASARQPVNFFQPNVNADVLTATSEFYEQKADDRTLIPRYVTGDSDVSGAGGTASGLAMLMNASARGIKRVIRNVDRDIIRPSIRAMYIYNMLHSKDDAVKGDAQIVPRGAVAMLTKEQTQLRQQEFLAMTNNPTDMEIIGIEGRAMLLRAVANNLDMDVDKIVPTEEALRARVQMQAGMMQAEQASPEAEAEVTP